MIMMMDNDGKAVMVGDRVWDYSHREAGAVTGFRRQVCDEPIAVIMTDGGQGFLTANFRVIGREV